MFNLFGNRDPWFNAPLRLHDIRHMLVRVLENQEIIMAVQQDIKDALDKLTADVAAETTIVGGLTTFIQGLKDQIQALADATKDTTTAQALQALATQIEVNNKSVADAMVANTEPVPTPPAEPVPEPFPPGSTNG